ncbi:Protein FAR1-RELATED SEQUENCE 5, partial [Cucurbita argyrosperma subsp. sororia]
MTMDRTAAQTKLDQLKPKQYLNVRVEFGVDGDSEVVGNSTLVDSKPLDENETGVSSIERIFDEDRDEKIIQDSSGRNAILGSVPGLPVVQADEPMLLSRSRRDGTAIGRALVCNKEGFRMPDKREKIVRQRAETRVGCRAMILVRKVNSGKWVVTKFVKEHTHPLSPGKGRRDCIYDQYPNEHDKIRELSQQLAIEKKRSATYKRHLEVIFEYIDEHKR